MVLSSADMLALIAELFTRRTSMVCGKMAKKNGQTLAQYLESAPKQAKDNLKVIARLHYRYLSGDYRHDEREILQVETFANWLIELAQNASGNPVRPLKLELSKLETKERCKPKTYMQCMAKVRQEW